MDINTRVCTVATLARSLWRVAPAVPVLMWLLALSGCATPPPAVRTVEPPVTQSRTLPAAAPVPAGVVQLQEAGRWRLRMQINVGADGQPADGSYEFSALRCSGRLTYSGFDDALREHQFLQRLEAGRCVRDCRLLVNDGMTQYREQCQARVTGGGQLTTTTPDVLRRFTAQNADARARAAQARRDEVDRLAVLQARLELERDQAAAGQARTPAEFETLRLRLLGKDAQAVALLDARSAAFSADEADRVGKLDESGLRGFLKDRDTQAMLPELAATAQGLASAKVRLRQMLLVQVASGSDAQREALLSDSLADRDISEKALARLRADYTQRREFAPLLRLYEITKDVALLKAAQPLARSPDDRRRIEQAAVLLTRYPGRLFDVRGSFSGGQVTSEVQENMGVLSAFTVHVLKPVRGGVAVKLRPDSPLRLRHGRYRITVDVELNIRRDEELRSTFLGDKNNRSDITKATAVQVTLGPPNYDGVATFDFGTLRLGYLQSGARGGYTAVRLLDDPVVSLRARSVDVLDAAD